MTVKDESAPLGSEMPCVSVTALFGENEVSLRGRAAIIVVLGDDENGDSVVGGDIGAAELAVLNRAAVKAADDAASDAGCKSDYNLGLIHLIVDEMAGKESFHAAD